LLTRGYTDVTALAPRKVETQQEKLQRLTAEVAALRRQLRQAQRLATVGTMTAMVSHELNNILTPIINYAQMARRNPALVEKAISRAAEGGQRATSICKAILGLVREDTDRPSRISLAEVVQDTIDAMARDPKRDCIDLRVRVPAELALTTRRAELQQVVLNLLINARAAVLEKAGPRWIDVSARRRNGTVEISVCDNGVGISPEHVESIFEPFFTTKDGSDEGSHGHGLGLAFCRQAVESLGGVISVASRPGEGSTFTVRLPS
jgi:signal transduction histidine kinase